MLPVTKAWGDPLYFYALPTREQAKRVAWRALKALVPQEWLKDEPNESELRIDTIFGSTLYVVGMDKPQRIEGNQWDGGVLDESCDQKPGSFSRSVVPALTHRRGWCWRIGVPKRFGPGAKDFRDFYEKAASGLDPQTEAYSWHSEDVAPAEEIAWAKENLDPRDFAEQYEASWEDAQGLIFHSFSRDLNVQPLIKYNKDLPILVGSDFNVDPMAWVLAQEYGDELHVFDEIWLRNTNTPATLDLLAHRYGGHQQGFMFYGDAAGRARKSSASRSDYQWIKADERFKNATIHYPKANPPVSDRVACTNALLRNAKNVRRLMISSKCVQLITDLSNRAFLEGSREPDDRAHDTGHITDALGYLIHARFPIKWVTGGTRGIYAGV